MIKSNPVIIMDLHYGGLQVARNLGCKGIPVFGIDKNSNPIGQHSRYIQLIHKHNGVATLKYFIADVYRKFERQPVLIPMSDYYLSYIVKNWKTVSENCLLPISDPEMVSRLVSKTKSVELFLYHGIETPKTIVLKKDDFLPEKLKTIELPCVIKPDYHDNWEGDLNVIQYIGSGQRTFIAEHSSSLENAVKFLKPFDDMILQEFIPGPSENSFYYVGYRDQKGRITTSYIGCKLRSTPDCRGSETILKSIHNPDLIKLGDEIMHRLNYFGPAGIDFKYDFRDGKYKVIEINARLGLNDCYLSVNGQDVSYVYYQDSQGKEVVPQRNYPPDVTWYDFRRDLGWMVEYRKKHNLSWRVWLKELIRGYDNYALFSRCDPAPFMYSLLNEIPVIIKKIFKKMFMCFHGPK